MVRVWNSSDDVSDLSKWKTIVLITKILSTLASVTVNLRFMLRKSNGVRNIHLEEVSIIPTTVCSVSFTILAAVQ
ncbi:Hypothetical protein D9617_107g041430 [Elsinoe fawcettii]|nr:Hypothetical protein D9617_107g041430 [Elsinoe fawcettii]